MRSLTVLSVFASLFLFSPFSSPLQVQSKTLRNEEVRRSLLSFVEKHGNSSFQCSPSGPCVVCSYSEKNDEKYRCSETGYRIPLRCVEIGGVKEEAKGKKFSKRRLSTEDDVHFTSRPNLVFKKAFEHARDLARSVRNYRRLLDASSTWEDGKRTYITYRSCIPPVDDERLSVLGFEGIMLCMLLISGTVVYYRRKRNATIPGAVRIQTNSRF